MTDNEIKKALECCILGDCQGCFYGDTDQRHCKDDLMQNALDLINRLEEKNSNLTSNLTSLQNDLTSAKAEIGDLRAEKVKHFLAYEKDRKRVKSEAVKEFAERLKGSLALNVRVSNDDYLDIATDVDNLVKEIVGEHE